MMNACADTPTDPHFMKTIYPILSSPPLHDVTLVANSHINSSVTLARRLARLHYVVIRQHSKNKVSLLES